MIFRALLFFILLASVAAATAWFARYPGDVTMVWQSYRVDTSVGVLLLAVAIVACVTALVYRFWWLVRGLPARLARRRAERHRRQGYLALTQGMVAVAAGDAGEARRQAQRADQLLGEPPLALLLNAQAAQIDGDEPAARKLFGAMLDWPETEFLAVRGLLSLAERDGDAETALTHARRAQRLRPGTPWVLNTLFDLEARTGRWEDAQKTIESAAKAKSLPADTARRKRAVVLLERGQDGAAGDKALDFARKAHGLAPDLLPATIRLAEIWLEEGNTRRARKLIEEAWRRRPHPELARLYGRTESERGAIARLKRIERLAGLAPEHRESRLALARASLAAKLWGEARRHLASLDEPPTEGVCRLMAEIEDSEGSDAAAARDWLDRAQQAEPDAAWVCGGCGAVASDWAATCGHCGAFDSLAWNTPPRVVALAPGEVTPPPAGPVPSLPAR